MPEGFAKRSGNSSSEELKSSSSSSSEPRITALRSLTVDEGTGGGEEKRAAGNGGDDGGDGVELEDEVGEDAGPKAVRGGLCDGFGAGLKKLVMLPFLDMPGSTRHAHHGLSCRAVWWVVFLVVWTA